MSEKSNQRSNTDKAVAIQLSAGKMYAIESFSIAYEEQAKESIPDEKLKALKKEVTRKKEICK